jgi:LuxR family maltose regulon positive regulatory protein
VLVDEGSRVRELLRHAVTRGLGGESARRVLAAFDAPARPAAQPATPPARAPAADSVQPLTARELEIVRLIAAGLRNQEIAEHLSVAPATVKRHVANAYAKLGARHRVEALARARELGVL